jgi:hypothetical protein
MLTLQCIPFLLLVKKNMREWTTNESIQWFHRRFCCEKQAMPLVNSAEKPYLLKQSNFPHSKTYLHKQWIKLFSLLSIVLHFLKIRL